MDNNAMVPCKVHSINRELDTMSVTTYAVGMTFRNIFKTSRTCLSVYLITTPTDSPLDRKTILKRAVEQSMLSWDKDELGFRDDWDAEMVSISQQILSFS